MQVSIPSSRHLRRPTRATTSPSAVLVSCSLRVLGRYFECDGGLTNALRAHKPGDTVPIVILRDGQRVTVTATLGTRGG